jgi:hypothetical protein
MADPGGVREHPFSEWRLLQLLGKRCYGLSLLAFGFPSALLAIRSLPAVLLRFERLETILQII